MSLTDTDPSRPRRRPGPLSRLWSRWRDRRGRLASPYSTVSVPPTRWTTNHEETFSFDTHCRGDAYEFTVEVDLCWCVTGSGTAEELRGRIDARHGEVIAGIKAAARPVGRRYAPYRPDDAEQPIADAIREAVDNTLAATPDEYGAVVTCTPRTRVDMDAALRELQRPLVTEQVRLEGRFDLSALWARRLGELRVVWRDFVREGLPEWESPYAVSLAQQPELAAKELFAMRKDRREEAQGLVDVVAATAAGHERLDLLEFAVASDSALRKTYDLLGIPVPDPGPDSLFGAGDDFGRSTAP
ncbi:hypothetical protein [Frankia sp. CcI49]|uniref:hypothetical protein n=1 Tax=Frankia sp. CcI49 TaxID=1745382 RepID=UPI00105499D2|nr:hypothetical protein [Frankia sp. CcI49]